MPDVVRIHPSLHCCIIFWIIFALRTNVPLKLKIAETKTSPRARIMKFSAEFNASLDKDSVCLTIAVSLLFRVHAIVPNSFKTSPFGHYVIIISVHWWIHILYEWKCKQNGAKVKRFLPEAKGSFFIREADPYEAFLSRWPWWTKKKKSRQATA